eukprot:06601.XXX_294738_294914_1 [CDS] Oithona nana genome sequencing.
MVFMEMSNVDVLRNGKAISIRKYIAKAFVNSSHFSFERHFGFVVEEFQCVGKMLCFVA